MKYMDSLCAFFDSVNSVSHCVSPSVFTSRLNIEEAVLRHCTGKLAPDKVIGVVPLK